MTSDHADTIAYGPHTMRVLAANPDYGYAEGRFVPGFPGPPLHRHSWDESFYVVSGQLTVVRGDRTQILDPGDFVLSPGGEFHTFSVHGSEAVLFVAGFHPGVGLDYIREMAGVFGPSGPDQAQLADIHARYGVIRRGD